MANNMTVEGLIELLKEEYPQALVRVEIPWDHPNENVAELVPHRLKPSRNGRVRLCHV